MKCQNCSKQALKEKLKHLGPLCSKCLKRVLHRRIRKEFRNYPWFRPGEKVVLVKEDNPRFALLKEAFESIIKGFPLQWKTAKIDIADIAKAAKSFDRVIVAWTAEDEITAFLREILDSKARAPEPKNLIKPLKHITNEEVGLYAGLKGLKMPVEKESLKALMAGLEKKYPSTKFALLESIEGLKK